MNLRLLVKKQISSKALRSLHVHNEQIYAGSTDNFMYCLDIHFNTLHPPIEHLDTVFSIEYTDKHIVTGCKDARIRVFEAETLQLIKTIDAHWYHVKSIAKNPSQPILISTSMDKTIRLWNTKTWELLKVIDFQKHEAHTSSVNCGLWLNENIVISCSDDRSIQAFHIELKKHVILSDKLILEEIEKGTILIEPFIRECLGTNSYDVHLGKHLATYTGRILDAKAHNEVEHFEIPPEGLVLEPGVLYLGVTEEYTETHAHVPFLEGKSSTGRLGIDIHATAGKGDVGFCKYLDT